MIHFKAWCHICRIPAHVFKPSSILRFNARKRILKAGKCTLMDAFGRQNSDGLGGSTVKGKGTPVLGSGIFQKTWGDVQSSQTYSPSETFHHERLPTPQIALIRGKTALMFSEYCILVPICLSGAESTQKITANSTYWEEKLKGAGGVARSRGKEGCWGSGLRQLWLDSRRQG